MDEEIKIDDNISIYIYQSFSGEGIAMIAVKSAIYNSFTPPSGFTEQPRSDVFLSDINYFKGKLVDLPVEFLVEEPLIVEG